MSENIADPAPTKPLPSEMYRGDLDADNSQAVQSLLSMSTAHIAKDSSKANAPWKDSTKSPMVGQETCNIPETSTQPDTSVQPKYTDHYLTIHTDKEVIRAGWVQATTMPEVLPSSSHESSVTYTKPHKNILKSVPATHEDDLEANANNTEKIGEKSLAHQSTSGFSNLNKSRDSLDCSFTDTDDEDDEEDENKSKEVNFFRITFDSDNDAKSSSDNDEFLTCSVCGKELPETAVADGGNEMCTTCRIIRKDPQENTPKQVKKVRKNIGETIVLKNTTVTTVLKEPIHKDSNPEEPLLPLRKSLRKRVSKVAMVDAAGASDEEVDSGAVDMSDQDADYVSGPKKKNSPEKKERKTKNDADLSIGQYAQELNLAPVVKADPDAVTVPADKVIVDEIDIEAMYSNLTKEGKKKGRPKGSKNKPKSLKEQKIPKRDMKFNKRWHRERGPVPDTNPDATDGMWSCEFCPKKFTLRRNFLAHRRKHSGKHKCDECEETFECNSKLQRHIRRHRGEKPFACHICPKAYSENMWLQRHLATHVGEGEEPLPKPYQCNICGRQYTHKGTMIYHMKTHTETKFYQCDVCGKQFTHRSSLECHIKVHTGEKPHVCEICGKRFADRSVQLRHTRSHSGDKPYKCTICLKGFTQSGTLKIHMRTHTTEKPYKCKVCDMGFMKRCDLTKHSKTHIGEMLSNQENLITCRVDEGRGADIQKKAAQILIDAYGKKKDDGTIEIGTHQFEEESDSDNSTDMQTSNQLYNMPLANQVPNMQQPQVTHMQPSISPNQLTQMIKSMDVPVIDIRSMATQPMSRNEQPQVIDLQQQEEFHRHAVEFIMMKRHELEQQEMERVHLLQQQSLEKQDQGSEVEPQMIQHQVEVLTSNKPSERHLVEQQIVQHMEQHAAQRHLLEQVEGQMEPHIRPPHKQGEQIPRSIVNYNVQAPVDRPVENITQERLIEQNRQPEYTTSGRQFLGNETSSEHQFEHQPGQTMFLKQEIQTMPVQMVDGDRQMDKDLALQQEQRLAMEQHGQQGQYMASKQPVNEEPRVEVDIVHHNEERQVMEQHGELERHIEQQLAQRKLLEQEREMERHLKRHSEQRHLIQQVLEQHGQIQRQMEQEAEQRKVIGQKVDQPLHQHAVARLLLEQGGGSKEHLEQNTPGRHVLEGGSQSSQYEHETVQQFMKQEVPTEMSESVPETHGDPPQSEHPVGSVVHPYKQHEDKQLPIQDVWVEKYN